MQNFRDSKKSFHILPSGETGPKVDGMLRKKLLSIC